VRSFCIAPDAITKVTTVIPGEHRTVACDAREGDPGGETVLLSKRSTRVRRLSNIAIA